MRRSIATVVALVVLGGCLGPAVPAPGGTPTATDRPTTDAAPTTAVPVPHETLVYDSGGTGAPAVEGRIATDSDGSYTQRYYVTTIATREETDRLNESVLPGDSTSGKLLCSWSTPNQAWLVGRRNLCDI